MTISTLVAQDTLRYKTIRVTTAPKIRTTPSGRHYKVREPILGPRALYTPSGPHPADEITTDSADSTVVTGRALEHSTKALTIHEQRVYGATMPPPCNACSPPANITRKLAT